MAVPGSSWSLVAEYQDWSGETKIFAECGTRNIPVGKITSETVNRPRQPSDYQDFREHLEEETQMERWPSANSPFWVEFFDSVRDAHYAAEVVIE